MLELTTKLQDDKEKENTPVSPIIWFEQVVDEVLPWWPKLLVNSCTVSCIFRMWNFSNLWEPISDHWLIQWFKKYNIPLCHVTKLINLHWFLSFKFSYLDFSISKPLCLRNYTLYGASFEAGIEIDCSLSKRLYGAQQALRAALACIQLIFNKRLRRRLLENPMQLIELLICPLCLRNCSTNLH